MNFALFREDLTNKGWTEMDLMRAAKTNPMRVKRFIDGEYRSIHTWKLFAEALGFEVDRYIVRSEAAA